MRKALAIIAVPVAVVALMAARPGNEFQLFTQLNGQPTRWVMPDGGRSGIFTTFDAGAGNACGCAPLTGARTMGGTGTLQAISPNVVVAVPATPSNICARPSASSLRWDGGCNLTDTDENFGLPVQPFVPWYETVDPGATALCACSDAGFLRVPLWVVQ